MKIEVESVAALDYKLNVPMRMALSVDGNIKLKERNSTMQSELRTQNDLRVEKGYREGVCGSPIIDKSELSKRKLDFLKCAQCDYGWRENRAHKGFC